MMIGTRGWTTLVGGLCSLLLLGWAAVQSSPEVEKAKPIEVTLTLRADDGPYGTSAYSFRYGSQDVDVHRNEVDILFNNCGNLHIDNGGTNHRIVRVDATKLKDVKTLPEDGWSTACIAPEKLGVYVLELDDGQHKSAVKLRITEAKAQRIVFKWLPFAAKPESQRGTHGTCGGPHDCPGG